MGVNWVSDGVDINSRGIYVNIDLPGVSENIQKYALTCAYTHTFKDDLKYSNIEN